MKTLLAMFMVGLMVASASAISINEIRIDQPSTDNDEYFELAGTPGESLDGMTYLVLGDGTGGSGVIEAVVDLTGLTIPADGYFLAAESTFALDPGQVDLTTTLNFENSDNVTHRLVSNFTGAANDDLDTDDDGVLDIMPWDSVLDSIALVENLDSPPTGTEWWYGPTVGPDGSYVPGQVYRFPNGTGAWQIGAFDPYPTEGEPDDTPGVANLPEPATLALLAIGGLVALRRRS